MEEKLGLMVWSPLAGGLLSGKFGPGAKAEEGRPAGELRLPAGEPGPGLGLRRGHARNRRGARSLGRPGGPGLAAGQAPRDERDHRRQDRLAQLDDNLAAAELALRPEEIARLDEVSALPAEYPGWMLERQGGLRRPKPVAPK